MATPTEEQMALSPLSIPKERQYHETATSVVLTDGMVHLAAEANLQATFVERSIITVDVSQAKALELEIVAWATSHPLSRGEKSVATRFIDRINLALLTTHRADVAHREQAIAELREMVASDQPAVITYRYDRYQDGVLLSAMNGTERIATTTIKAAFEIVGDNLATLYVTNQGMRVTGVADVVSNTIEDAVDKAHLMLGEAVDAYEVAVNARAKEARALLEKEGLI
jgi:hypothetical protein